MISQSGNGETIKQTDNTERQFFLFIDWIGVPSINNE